MKQINLELEWILSQCRLEYFRKVNTLSDQSWDCLYYTPISEGLTPLQINITNDLKDISLTTFTYGYDLWKI